MLQAANFRRFRRRVLLALTATVLAALAWTWFASGRQTAQRAQAERLVCALPAEPANTAHQGMVWVAGGSFDFGDTVYPEEQPVRRTTVDGFWIDRTEVTNDAFAQFVQATGYITVAERPVDPRLHAALPPEMRLPGAVVFVMPNAVQGAGDVTQWWRYIPGANWRHPGGPGTNITGRGAFPVVTVTYEDALAYARWKGRSLPTEAQWECAVHTQPALHWGAVWEWTDSVFEPYAGFVAHPYRDYSAPWFGSRKVLRGACLATAQEMVNARYRNFFPPERRDIFAGFRTVGPA